MKPMNSKDKKHKYAPIPIAFIMTRADQTSEVNYWDSTERLAEDYTKPRHITSADIEAASWI